jgi:alcohol dehydrogenase
MTPKYFEFNCPVKILSGRKALANVPYELSQLGCRHPLLVTDQGVMKAGLINLVQAAFDDSDMKIAASFADVPVDSNNRVVNALARLYNDKGCDCILAVGGGSVIDTAKGVNIVVSEQDDDLLKFQGVDRVTARMQPFVAVPTTAGTGSEVTAAAVIYNEDAGVKMALMSNRLYPHVAVLDPALMQTMPARITAATGMDALTHAVEAYTCIQKNPVSDAFAAAAIMLVRDNLILAVENGKDENMRLNMANAALLAGVAFSNSMVGMVHALAHATGAVAHVPHGVANSIYLPHVLEYNLETIPELIAGLAPLVGGGSSGHDVQTQALAAIASIRALARRLNELCGHPLTLSAAGVKSEQLDRIATVALNDGSLTYNPKEADRDELLTVIHKAFG